MQHYKTLFAFGVAAISLTACSVEGPETTSGGELVVAPTPTPSSNPAPSPTPTPAPVPPSATLGSSNTQMAAVSSGLDVSSMLRAVSGETSDAGSDALGAFRFACVPSHFSYDDPIVHPGKPGAAHLHMFFGNTGTDAFSTYESLRKTGKSTCVNELNRSAYWMPALLDGKGSAIVPSHLTVYYKRRPKSDPWFAAERNIPDILPRGLRYVFGDDGVKPTFGCEGGLQGNSMPEVLRQCSPGSQFYAIIPAPQCWDGYNLDSADHRSHMKYQGSHAGGEACPSSHPYHLGRLTLTVKWDIEVGDSPSLWRFSSDMDGREPGASLHADWFGAWEDSVLKAWHDNCIDKHLSCNSGNLGNGSKLNWNEFYSKLDAPRQLIPLSSIPR